MLKLNFLKLNLSKYCLFCYRSYLKDLVETAHVFLKMLKHFCSKTGNLMVQGKPKKKQKTKKSKILSKDKKLII